MHYVERTPVAALRPWVDKLWALSDAPDHARERILPNGTLELVINLQEDEFRIYHANEPVPCRRFRGAVVSGAYDRFFGIDTREHASVLGVHFKPAGASAVLGVPAGQLRNAHGLTLDVSERFDIIESELCARLAAPRQHAAIAIAIAQLERGVPVANVASRLGFSHRRLIQSFDAAVGLTPKAFARVCRFQRVLSQSRASEAPDWAALAARGGYCDQSHLIREFIAFSGLPPSLLLRSSAVPVKEHHIALPANG